MPRIRSIKPDLWKALNESPYHPLLNKPLSALYPPGSTFKMISAMAAEMAGVRPNFTVSCPGKIWYGNRYFHCWKKGGHGGGIVHSVVSFDFAVSLVPGWHMTIFPPYFVTGAIFAGFAMEVMAMVVVRETMNLKNLITMYHLDVMNKINLTCSCLKAYAYMMEGWTAWYSMNEYIHHTFREYIAGTYGWAGWLTITCNTVIPQLFWVRRFRRSYPAMLPVLHLDRIYVRGFRIKLAHVHRGLHWARISDHAALSALLTRE